MGERILYDYWRSSAAFRVRIALHFKQLPFTQRAVLLLNDIQRTPDYLALNPQGLVPLLLDQGVGLTQSLAICEYLEEAYPDTPRLLPADPLARARVRQLAQLVACDVHPLGNLRVQRYLEQRMGVADCARQNWTRHWMAEGFTALEHLLDANRAQGFSCGAEFTLADACIAPQLFNAARVELDLGPWPRLAALGERLAAHPAVQAAHPQAQPDAPPPD